MPQIGFSVAISDTFKLIYIEKKEERPGGRDCP